MGVMWLGLFSFDASAQKCIQQGGNLTGCVSPIGITYGNKDIGYFSSETAAANAQGQYYIDTRVSCKECYGLGVTFEPYNYEVWSCPSERTSQGHDRIYTRIGPEGKYTVNAAIYETRVFVHGITTGPCPADSRNGSYKKYYNALDSNSIYAYVRCPANYIRTAGNPEPNAPNFGYLCRPSIDQTVNSPQEDYPNKDCADHNTYGSRSTKNPINLSSKCKNEVVADLEISNAPYPISWLRFAGQRNSRGVWSFEGHRSLSVTNYPMTTGSYIGKDIVTVDRRNGGRLVFTATPVSNGVRQWSGTSTSSPTSLEEQLNGTTRSWRVHQRNGETETYNSAGSFVRKTSPSGHNHHYSYEYTNPEHDGNGQRLTNIRDDFGNVLTLSYNSGYNSQTSVPAVSNNPVNYSSSLTNLMSSSLPQSISDGSRTVSYSWYTNFISASVQTIPHLLAVEGPDGGITEYFYGEAFPNQSNVSKYALTGEADQEGLRYKTYQYVNNTSASTYSAEWMGAGPDGVGALEKMSFNSVSLTDQDGNVFGVQNPGTYSYYSKKCPDCKGNSPLQKYYRYSALGVYETEDWNGVKNSIVYDTFGRVTKVVAAANKASVAQTVEYTYDPNGTYREPLSKTEQVLVNNAVHTRTTTYTYSILPASYGAQSPCSGAYGGVDVPCPTTRRLLTKITVAVDDGSVAREMNISYTPYGLKDTVVTPTGQVIKYQWNEKGQIVSVAYGYGTTDVQLYTYGGHTAYGPSYMIAPNNLVTVWIRDINGRITQERTGSTSGAIGSISNGVFVPTNGGTWRTSTYHWRLNNLLEWAQLPDGRKVSFVYDGARRITQMQATGPNNTLLWTRTLTWSLAGSLLNTQVRNSSNTVEWNDSAVYNAVRDVAQMVDGNNNATALGYNSNYLSNSVTTPLGNTHSRVFDDLDRPITFTDALGNVARLSYGPQNEVVSAKDQRLVNTIYTYNGFGDMIGISSPDRGVWSFEYNNVGQLITTTDPRGVQSVHTYDGLDRLRSRQFTGGSGTGFTPTSASEQFAYGSCGVNKICSMSDDSGTTTYTYNIYGEITSIMWNDGNASLTQTYTYTPEGLVESMTYPSGKVLSIGYGSNALPSSLRYNNTPVAQNITWTTFNAVRNWTWGQSTGWSGTHSTVAFEYDLAGQPTSISDIDQRTLLFDADGRLVAVNDANANYSQLYGYDKNARLISADIGKWNIGKNYTYDAAGNRTSLMDSNGVSGWQYAYGLSNNRLIGVTPVVSVGSGSTNAPIYDAMGNMIFDGIGTTMTYNSQGRLQSVNGTEYTYNALGQRRSKNDGTKRAFIHDPMGRLVGEYEWNGSQWATDSEYIYLDNWRTIAVVRPDNLTGMNNPKIHPIISDHLGTPRKVLDGDSGQPVWSWDAKDPFGNEHPDENPSGLGDFKLDLRFPGQQFDSESGFFHNGFRTYHPKWGRYIQSDPLGLEAGWNTYVYVDGNPLTVIDPEGLNGVLNAWRMYFMFEQPIQHQYSGQTYLCTVGPNCSRQRAEESLRRNAYPGQLLHSPVTSEATYRKVLWSMPIETQGSGSCIQNTTLDGHIFHDGKVVRSIVERNGKLYVNTEGSGTNPGYLRWWLNMSVWRPGFYLPDQSIKHDAQKGN